jgi:phage portal protein BeeE
MQSRKIIMTDGSRYVDLYRVKSINPYTDETPGVWVPDTEVEKAAKSTRLVPSVFAGVQARMQAMSDMPFTIYGRGDKVIDSSDYYENKVGIWPEPFRYLGMTEASLVIAGQCYWFKAAGARSGKTRALQYWKPDSVTLDPQRAQKREIFFRRQGTDQKEFPEEAVHYLWGIDPSVELGPPTVWPLQSALVSAQAQGAISAWVRDYMLRGAIKAMLLMVDGAPPPGEVERMETWFNKFMNGVRGFGWKVFNAAGTKPQVIGEGLDALRDLSITRDLRYDIHQALGTRHLLEDENYATASVRERQFYTQTIMPDARLIQSALNEQVFKPLEVRIQFEPERLEIFQTDEAERAGSLSQLYQVFSGAISPPQALDLAMQILGYNLTKEQRALIATGIDEKQKAVAEARRAMQEKERIKPEAVQEEEEKPVNKRALVELDKWEAKVQKAGKMVTWHAVDLSDEIVRAVKCGEMTFDQARQRIKPMPAITDLLRGIELGVRALESRNG